MSNAKKVENTQESELLFQNNQETLDNLSGNEPFFRELDALVKKFHKNIEKHGKKHGVKLNSSVFFQIEDNKTQ